MIGAANIAHFALLNQSGKCSQGFFHGGDGVGGVVEVEVNIVSAQATQGRFDSAHDVTPGTSHPVVSTVGAIHIHAKFRNNHDFVPVNAGVFDRLAEHGFRYPRPSPVNIGNIKESDALLHGGCQHIVGAGLSFGGGFASTQVVTAQAHARNG